MKLMPFIIEKFAKFIVGGVPFESMKRIVLGLSSAAFSGDQKRELAINEFKTFGYDLANFIINLAVELAVSWLKSKQR